MPLIVAAWDETDPIETTQRDAVQLFTERKNELSQQADDALYAHYLERLPELREQFGDSADELIPIIRSKEELNRMITPTTFFVPYPFRGSSDRVIGPLYNSTWEPELGLTVKFVNEAIEEVGPQDIIL
nr:hypothetical protein [Mycobacteroides abscessus]